jgi:hypothetical protein
VLDKTENQKPREITEESLSIQAQALRQEAIDIINQSIFKLPSNMENSTSGRLVDCIVSIAITEVCKLMVTSSTR